MARTSHSDKDLPQFSMKLFQFQSELQVVCVCVCLGGAASKESMGSGNFLKTGVCCAPWFSWSSPNDGFNSTSKWFSLTMIFEDVTPVKREKKNWEAPSQVSDRSTQPCKLNYCCSPRFRNEMSLLFFFLVPWALLVKVLPWLQGEEDWWLLLLLCCPLLVPKLPSATHQKPLQGNHIGWEHQQVKGTVGSAEIIIFFCKFFFL